MKRTPMHIITVHHNVAADIAERTKTYVLQDHPPPPMPVDVAIRAALLDPPDPEGNWRVRRGAGRKRPALAQPTGDIMTDIEWTDKTWNPIRGCTRVSEGCRNCYAERIAARFSGPGQPYAGLARMTNGGPRWTGSVRFVNAKLYDPAAWRTPVRVFVNSMSDLFHEQVSTAEIAMIFAVMAGCPRHTFQVLTKRPGRAKSFLDWAVYSDPNPECTPMMNIHMEGLQYELETNDDCRGWFHSNAESDIDAWPIPNVWLGVSAENQSTFGERVPILLECPAAVRWVSLEPLLEPIDLSRHIDRLDWVVVGGESGPGARPCELGWIESVVAQCKTAGVPVFVKQLGSKHPNHKRFDAWPGSLCVREWPRSGVKP